MIEQSDCSSFSLINVYSKIKDCQVVATRISRDLGGRDDSTELQVGAVEETQLYNVSKVTSYNLIHDCTFPVL